MAENEQHPRRRAPRLAAIVVGALVVIGGVAAASPAQADTWVPITGSGSTWAQDAIGLYRGQVEAQYGMTVNYSGTGSSAGRQDFINGAVDFAVSEIPFQAHPEDGSPPEVPRVPYAYLPLAAGATSFAYNLKVDGARVTDLRLSGDTISKIFTGVITRWNDPEIQADNPAIRMPDRTITPVLRSDGSGSTAQFTGWMASQHPDVWNAFCTMVGRSSPCGATSQFPGFGNAKLQNGSLGVVGYVSQDYGEGAITYVENSYALRSGLPVAKVLNAAGYYVAPSAPAVSIALSKATTNADLTQNLDAVYSNTDTRSYPLSSYTYAIVPMQAGGIFNTDKGKTLDDFLSYAECTGQQHVADLGYAPLPRNLVAAASDQITKIPGARPGGIDLSTCNNPAFGVESTAPAPPACDQHGSVQCVHGTAVGYGDFAVAAYPVIVGTPQVGQTLVASPAIWAPSPDRISYQWSRASTPIAGATAQSYLLGPDDFGKSLTVTTTAEKFDYRSSQSTSLPTAAIAWNPYFADVSSANPFFADIQWMASSGISTGTPQPNGLPTYAPTDSVSRQAMAAFLYRYSGESFQPPATPSFRDVPTSSPFYAAVEWMKAKNITTGNADGTFAPTNPVTRQAMAAFLYRYSAGAPVATASPSFTDVSPSHPFYQAIEWMKAEQISTGYSDGTFAPTAPVTRQAMAAFLNRMRTLVG